MPDPIPPTNVRVEHPDGTTTPLELYFDGYDDDGLAVWVATGYAGEFVAVLADEVPAMTSITFRGHSDV